MRQFSMWVVSHVTASDSNVPPNPLSELTPSSSTMPLSIQNFCPKQLGGKEIHDTRLSSAHQMRLMLWGLFSAASHEWGASSSTIALSIQNFCPEYLSILNVAHPLVGSKAFKRGQNEVDAVGLFSAAYEWGARSSTMALSIQNFCLK